MLEAFMTIVTITIVIVFLRYQNNLIRSYIAAFVVYFFVGWFFSINVKISQLLLYNFCILSIVGGVLFSDVITFSLRNPISNSVSNLSKYKDDGLVSFNPLVVFVLISLVIIALSSYVVLIVTHGVPVLNISARKEVSGFFTYLIGLLWIIYPFLYVALSKKRLLLMTLVIVFVLLTMGYRTPLAAVVLMFFLLNVKYERFEFNLKIKVITLVLLLSLVTLYPLLRFQDDPEAIIKLLGNLDLPPEYFIFAPFILVFAEGAGVVQGITQIYTDIGPQWGSFTYNGFSTILPGEQLHSRTLLSYMLGRTNWQDSTTTSTLIGQFYLEGGRNFTYIMSFLLGFFLSFGTYRYLYKSDIFASAPFIIAFVFLSLSIHTGLLDPIILYVLFIYFVMHVCNEVGNSIFEKS